MGTLTYYLRVSGVRERQFRNLELLRDTHIAEINGWAKERRADLELLSTSPRIIEMCEQQHRGARVDTADNRAYLERVRSAYGYDAIYLAEPNTGRPFVTTDVDDIKPHTLNEAYCSKVIQTGATVESDVFVDVVHERPEVLFATPVRIAQTAEIPAILVFQLDMAGHIYRFLLETERLGGGETCEAFLVNEDGLVQSPLRFYDDAVGNLTLKAEPAQRAATGQSGRMAVEDYRSVPVMAAYGYVHGTGWGIVVKQDMAEINAPVVNIAGTITLVSACALIGSALVGLFIARKIARPASYIADAAEQIGAGNVEVRAEEVGPSELRKVAASLNQMVNRLGQQFRVNSALSEIYSEASAQSRVGDLLNEVLSKLMEATRSQVAVAYLADRRAETMHCELARGIGRNEIPQHIRLNPPDTLVSEAVAMGRVLVSNDIPEGNELVVNTPAGKSRPRSLLCIPLTRAGRKIGGIGLASLYDYREGDRQIAETLSLNFGQAVAVCLAGQETELLAEQLRASNERLIEANRELNMRSGELQRQAEELTERTVELEAQRLKVAEADRLKSEFLSNMSHELRTPLNSIMALSQLMISRGPGRNPEQDAEYLTIIERNGRQLLKLINDILDLSRIEAGRVDFDFREIDPRELVRSAVDMTRPLADAKKLRLSADLGDPPAIRTDEHKTRQILLNLLSNAVKFTQSGGIDVTVSTSDETILFAVRDTGVGIAACDLDLIFQEFRQTDGSTTRRHDGAGLGLAISRRLARLLGGDVVVESMPGRGSTFTLTLPLHGRAPRSEAFSKAPPPTLEQSGSPGTPPAKRTVLVVDGETEGRDLLSSYLGEAGYQVATAPSGREGLRMAKELHPFAILLDESTPDMDARDVARALKSDTETVNLPVIVVSVGEDGGAEDALGVFGQLVKPVDRKALLDELTRITEAQAIRRILVVDDDPAMLRLMKYILVEEGYDVRTAAGGAEAIRRSKEAPPDVILLDLMMPEVDGFMVLEELRQDLATQTIPVILMTAKEITAQDLTRLGRAVRRIISKAAMEKEHLLRELREVLAELEQQILSHSDVGPREGAPAGPLPPSILKQRSLPRADIAGPILVVEDNPDNLATITAILDDMGRAYVTAGDGEEAVRIVRQKHIGLVLMDVQLPVLSGLDATRRIKGDPAYANTPVIALTAKAMKGDQERILAAGCDDYLAKPLNPADLVGMIHRWMDAQTLDQRSSTEDDAEPIT